MSRVYFAGFVALAALAFAEPSLGVGVSADATANSVSLRITVTTPPRFLHGKTQVRVYVLRCHPTESTVPFGGRLCGDITRYPLAMLDPSRQVSECSLQPGSPQVTVRSVRQGRTKTFNAHPGCEWPAGVPAAVFYYAVTRNLRLLVRAEAQLHCDELPSLRSSRPSSDKIASCLRG